MVFMNKNSLGEVISFGVQGAKQTDQVFLAKKIVDTFLEQNK